MRITSVVAPMVLLVACENSAEPTLRQRGWLAANYSSVQAPDTVRAGVPFVATVFVAGSGSIDCNRPDGASVTQVDRLARVEVFVRVSRGNIACTDDLKLYPVSVTITFPTAGQSTIRAVGLSCCGANAPLDSLERQVIVR